MKHEISHPSRRQFMNSTIGGLGLAAIQPLTARGQIQELANTRFQTASAQRYLVAKSAQFDVGASQLAGGLGFNNQFPGPVFELHAGETFSVGFQNYLDQPSTVHWHGMVVPHRVDGHPLNAVLPGHRFTYDFPIIQRACLNWYHPHPHGLTGEQVNLGLAGAFIIRDVEESNLPLPTGIYEVPLIIRDANFDSEGNLDYNPRQSGFFGRDPLVNGKLNARLDVHADVCRFRVLNGANARVFRLALSDQSLFTLIGNDGGLLEFAENLSEIELSPGERLDILIDFRNLAVGESVFLQDLDEPWDLIEFVVDNDDPPLYDLPAPVDRLSTILPLGTPQTVREFAFEGHNRINGLQYEMERMDFEVPFSQTELWRFTTSGNGPHPVHVHGTSFQVVSRTGGRDTLFPWEQGWKDTVLVHDHETVEVLIRFDAYADQIYLLHCHQLEHEDNGMMSNFRVLPAS